MPRQASARHAFIETFPGSLRDELLNEHVFDTPDDARRVVALYRYDGSAVRRHASLCNLMPLEARRTRAHPEGAAPGTLVLKPSPTTNLEPADPRYEPGSAGGRDHLQHWSKGGCHGASPA